MKFVPTSVNFNFSATNVSFSNFSAIVKVPRKKIKKNKKLREGEQTVIGEI